MFPVETAGGLAGGKGDGEVVGSGGDRGITGG